ncbi:hypothetical protein WA158_001017 [Blastocystis sp. Blastoise]
MDKKADVEQIQCTERSDDIHECNQYSSDVLSTKDNISNAYLQYASSEFYEEPNFQSTPQNYYNFNAQNSSSKSPIMGVPNSVSLSDQMIMNSIPVRQNYEYAENQMFNNNYYMAQYNPSVMMTEPSNVERYVQNPQLNTYEDNSIETIRYQNMNVGEVNFNPSSEEVQLLKQWIKSVLLVKGGKVSSANLGACLSRDNPFKYKELKKAYGGLIPFLRLCTDSFDISEDVQFISVSLHGLTKNEQEQEVMNTPESVEQLIFHICCLLKDAKDYTMKAVELANTIRDSLGMKYLSKIRENFCGLLNLLENYPKLFAVNRIAKNDTVVLIDNPDKYPSVQNNSNIYISRCLHVGNVGSTLTYNDIKTEFEEFGSIEDIKILNQGVRRYAFIYFTTPQEAKNAKDVLSKHGKWKGNITYSKKEKNFDKSENHDTPTRHLWVGNLTDATNDELHTLFHPFGAIQNIKIMNDKNCAFIDYFSTAEAIDAYTHMQGYIYRGRALELGYGKDKDITSPRSISSTTPPVSVSIASPTSRSSHPFTLSSPSSGSRTSSISEYTTSNDINTIKGHSTQSIGSPRFIASSPPSSPSTTNSSFLIPSNLILNYFQSIVKPYVYPYSISLFDVMLKLSIRSYDSNAFIEFYSKHIHSLQHLLVTYARNTIIETNSYIPIFHVFISIVQTSEYYFSSYPAINTEEYFSLTKNILFSTNVCIKWTKCESDSELIRHLQTLLTQHYTQGIHISQLDRVIQSFFGIYSVINMNNVSLFLSSYSNYFVLHQSILYLA